MSLILKSAVAVVVFAATSIAGEINIVQLGPPDPTRLEITCGGASQSVDLPHGGTTGRFVLPEKEALVSVPDSEIPALTVPATASPNIAVLSAGAEGYRWTLIPGKPTKEKWAMRAVNLGQETAELVQDGGPHEIKPDSTTVLPVEARAGMSIRIEGGGTFAYGGREPCAVVALIYRKQGEWQVLFVPDR